MDAAQGILTSRGGMTSHAAVVARGMGKPCVAGCEGIKVDEKNKKFSVGDLTVKEGDWVTIDGSSGRVMLGTVATIEPKLTGAFAELMSWADGMRKLRVRANADIPHDAQVARNFGAEGIGLCRTEHMFFAQDRLPHMVEMILAVTDEEKRKALDKLLPMQKSDFKGLFKIMRGFPVTIRLLDPPLHEFLPKRENLMVEISLLKERGGDGKVIEEKQKLLSRVEELHEFNPMLGLRGCRLGITLPEITRMQARAIFEAACEIYKEEKIKVIPEIMIPLVGHINELKAQKEVIQSVAEESLKAHGLKLQYSIGTMIELPRAAVTADEIAREAEFFSFGTNDLTQTAFGFSRDDAARFLGFYVEKGILPKDPFVTIDQDGVGALIKMGVAKGRKTNPRLKIGICGEHGGDPASVEFCHGAALNYVSCSPYRVPIARLAAAQAVIREKKKIYYTTK
jgi:pyruvate,orthophosphate dikinase